MYIANRRDSSKINGCSPLQNRNGLIGLKPEIAYLPYTSTFYAIDKQEMKFNEEQIKSAFLGQVIGDALGVPVEFKSRDYLKENPVHEYWGYFGKSSQICYLRFSAENP